MNPASKLNEIFDEGANPNNDDQTDLAQEKSKMKDKKQRECLTRKETNRLLIRRFNQHSSLVLKASERYPPNKKHFSLCVL